MVTFKYAYTSWLLFGLLLVLIVGTCGCAEEEVDDKKIGILFLGEGMEGDFTEPHRKNWLTWIYGNNIPDYYEYDALPSGLFNVADELQAVLPNRELVFRHAWDAQGKNVDDSASTAEIRDSTETAIRELIEEEQVDRIIGVLARSHLSNETAYGECWLSENGAGKSIEVDKTYKQCVYDLIEDQNTLSELEQNDPWDSYRAAFPYVYKKVQEIDPEMQITFAKGIGEYPAFAAMVVELLKRTIEMSFISSSSSLKVIVATEGIADGYLDKGACDFSPIAADAAAAWAVNAIDLHLNEEWGGEYTVAHGEIQKAEPSESGNDDPPAPGLLNGEIMSVGEEIDRAINGDVINGLGYLFNVVAGYEHVVVVPVTWVNDGTPTLVGLRQNSLGNHELVSVGTEDRWVRQTHDSDGTPYDEEDWDRYFSTTKVMDGTGWGSTPLDEDRVVPKGTMYPGATTVILSGAVLSSDDLTVKRRATEAMVASIVDAVHNPKVGGRLDTTCEEPPQ